MNERLNKSKHSAIWINEELIEPPVPMMIERVIDLTGEFHHLVELIDLRLGGAGCDINSPAFYRIVTSILTELDREIRTRVHPGMDFTEMRLLVQDWIDADIRRVR